jgi:hypothetical protein
MESLSNRRILLALAAAVTWFPLSAGAQSKPPKPLIIGVLSYETGESSAPDSVSRSAERGLQMGLEEAAETARLFGRSVQEKRVVIKRTDDADRAARVMARTTNMSALIVTNPELLASAERLPGTPGARYPVVVLRTLPSPASLECSSFSFAIYPSASALNSVGGRAGSTVALWGPSLERFGALELNDRYRSRWKTGMNSEAWAAWFAVKILSEAALRTRSNEPFVILNYIRKSEFDGHKGWPLTFRPEDHLLRQPLYIVSDVDSKVREELPNGGRSQTRSAAQVLDGVLPPRAGALCAESR